MFKLNLLIALVLGGMFNSCDYRKRYEVTSSISAIPLDSIPSELWFPELMAVNARSMIGIQSKLCLIGPNENMLTYFIKEETGEELGYAGVVGVGPEDMQPFPIYAGKSVNGDTIYLYDFNERKVNAYQLDETINGIPQLKLVMKKKLQNPLVGKYTSSYMGICKTANGYYVGLNFLSVGDKLLTLLDENLNIIKEFGEQPLSGLPPKGSVKSYRSFDGTLSVYGNSVYYAASKMSYLARYDITEDGNVIHKWTQRYTDVKYKIENRKNIKFKSDNLKGFSDMTIGKNYVLATYSGIPMSKMFKERNVNAIGARTLVVFNHEGEPLGRFKLRSCSFCVGLSEDEKYIYVMNIDPEVQIERIRMSDIEEVIRRNN